MAAKDLHTINRVLARFGFRLQRTTLGPVINAEPDGPSPDIRSDERKEEPMELDLVTPVAVSSADSVAGESKPTTAEDSGAATRPAFLAHEELVRIRKELPAIFERAAKKVATGELALVGWGLTLPRVQKLAQVHEGKLWFFIGDIHGDYLAWVRLFDHVSREKDFRLCFLGDLVDRGPLHIECFAAFLEAIERYPNQILWIVGNHDDGVRWNSKGSEFLPAGGIEPAEFVEWLNRTASEYSHDHVQKWGRLFVDVVARLPRAVLFPDGLLAVHGGVPLKDRWEFLTTMEAFHHERCLGDFTWARVVNYPRRDGWRTDRRQYSSDFGLGYTDLEGFCQTVQSVFPVKRLVCGHEHVENGFEQPDCYKKVPVLKLNGFGFDYLSNSVRRYRKNLVIGVSQSGLLPRVEDVLFQEEEYSRIYPETNIPVNAVSKDSPASPTDTPTVVPSGSKSMESDDKGAVLVQRGACV